MSAPRPFKVSGPVLLWVAAALLSACFEDPTDRFRAQEDLGLATLAGGATVVLIDPGARPIVESPTRLRFRASAPTAAVLIGHVGPGVFTTQVVIANLFEDAEIQPTLARLAGVAGCPDEGLGEAIVLAPFPSEVVGPQTLAVDVAVPPCALLVLRPVPREPRGEPGGAALNFAVVGETKGNLDVLGSITERMLELRESGEWTAHFLVALGNLANSPEQPELVSWEAAAAQAGVARVIALGADEVLDSGTLPFHQLFGRSDYTFAVGDVRFFVLDTASAGLSDAQLAFWRREMGAATESLRIALMQRPPIDAAGIRDAGFTSRIQAAQLIALLGENGVDAIFTGGVGSFERFDMGGIPIYSTGGGGGPIEGFSDVQNHFLRVTVVDGVLDVEVEAVP